MQVLHPYRPGSPAPSGATALPEPGHCDPQRWPWLRGVSPFPSRQSRPRMEGEGSPKPQLQARLGTKLNIPASQQLIVLQTAAKRRAERNTAVETRSPSETNRRDVGSAVQTRQEIISTRFTARLDLKAGGRRASRNHPCSPEPPGARPQVQL